MARTQKNSPPLSGYVTQRDIAKAAGLHFSTVSLALRNSPKLALETRERVRQIAESLHYQPDPMLASLNAYRKSKGTPHFQGTIAWINNWPKQSELRKTPGFNDYFLGASERAAELGYQIEEFWLHGTDISLKRLPSIFKARNIHGLLLAPQPRAKTLLPFDCTDFSVLSFGYSLSPASFHLVTNHQYHCMNLMLAELDRLGYRRIGITLTKDWDDKTDNLYISASLIAQRRRSLKAKLFLHIANQLEQESFNTWFKKHRPDVVVSLAMCETIATWIRDLGLRVPEDVGIAGLNVSKADGRLSGVDQNNVTIGRTAMDFLLGMLHRGERGAPVVPIRILVENTWQPGETLRRMSPRA